jgi:hypothetical protein
VALVGHSKIKNHLTARQANQFHVPRGLMVILQFIMGFIMGIYLMEIITGRLVTKKILTALKRDDFHP